MVFQNDEVNEIVIKVPQSIELISIDDISLKNSTKINRRLKFKSSICEMKGLMLLEVILYDTWKFINENTEIF